MEPKSRGDNSQQTAAIKCQVNKMQKDMILKAIDCPFSVSWQDSHRQSRAVLQGAIKSIE